MSLQCTYEPLKQESDGQSDVESLRSETSNGASIRVRPSWGRLQYISWSSHIISWTLVLVLVLLQIRANTWGSDRFRQHKLFPSQLTYSPAQDEVEYVVKTFEQGIEGVPFGMSPEFEGPPSDRLDQAWSDLYNCKSFTSTLDVH